MAIEKFADTPNQGITVLDGPLSDSATTIPVKSMADLKLTGLINFAYCKITKKANWRQHPINRKESFEIVKAEGVSGDDLETVTRGVDGTSGTEFDTGDIVEVVFVSIHYQHLVAALTDGTKELNIGAATFRGDVTISHGSNPSLLLAEFAGSPFRIRDQTASGARIVKISDSAGAVINIDCDPLDGTSAALIRLFREQTNTSGSRKFEIYRGDGSTDVTFRVDAATGEVTANDIIGLGDTYWVGAGTGIPFGHIYIDGAQVIVVALTVNTPTEVKDDGSTSAGDGWLAGELNLFTMAVSDLHYFSPDLAGKYEISWELSFMMPSPGANVEIHGGIAINGTPIMLKGEAHRTISNNSDTGNMGGSATLALAADDQISIWIENTTNSADVEAEHGNIIAKMVGG